LFDGWTQTWLDPEFRTWDLRPLLPLVRCPVLAMQGDDDDYGTRAQVNAIASGVGGPVETWILPECDHTPHREHRRMVLARSAAFMLNLTAAQLAKVAIADV
jgi:pimeloyl-ACP methyl ester carboxylesterase